MTHILFLSDNFPPEVNAPASRTLEHCREWVRAGHRVTVITGVPNFPRGRVFDGYRNRLWQTEEVDGIRVVRVWTYIAANSGFAYRILDYLSFMIMAVLAAPFVRKVDVVVGTSPQFFTACAAWAVSVYKWRPFVFELPDLWPESIKAVEAMGDSWLLRWLERLELFLYRRAAAVVAVTHSFKRNLVERGIDAEKINVVTNGVDTKHFKPTLRDQDLVQAMGLEGCFVTGYIGTHGMAHGLDTLLEAASLLQSHPDGAGIRLIFLGDGARKSELKKSAAEMGLDNVIFLDTAPKDQVVRYWSLLDVSIIHLRKTPLFMNIIPSKLFECMGMGIPVLHGVAGESAEIVRSTQCGIVFEPENAEELVARLIEIKNTPRYLRELSRNALKAASRFNRRRFAENMKGVLEDVTAHFAPASQGPHEADHGD